MTREEAVELTLAALADMPSGPPAQKILAVIQAAAWDEGYRRGWDAARGEPDTTNPYKEEL